MSVVRTHHGLPVCFSIHFFRIVGRVAQGSGLLSRGRASGPLVRIQHDPPSFLTFVFRPTSSMAEHRLDKAGVRGSIPRSATRFPEFTFLGGVAQLGEQLLCKQKVAGSIPVASTTFFSLVSSRGLGHRPFTAGTRVRIPHRAPSGVEIQRKL